MKNVNTNKDFYWEVLPDSPVASSRTDDIWFFDELTGWLVNSSGYVCKTEDGGAGWTPKFFLSPNAPSKPYLRCMSWANRQYGWFGSVTGIGDALVDYPSQYVKTLLHRTTDAGETWSPLENLPEDSPAGICGLYAVNEKVVYGSGTNDPGLPGPSIIKTTDGGESWELIDMQPYADNLIDIYFFDENRGFVVGGKIDEECSKIREGYPEPRLSRYAQLKPVILQTLDGGKTWKNTAAKTEGFSCGEWGWKIQFINQQLGFVSLENFTSAAILKTTDGGDSWQRCEVKDSDGEIINKDLEGIGFLDENRGWVGGWGNNFNGLMNSYTEDGGKTWVRQDHDPVNPNSDARVRINRYRLLGDPVTGGYCSGLQVYKLKFGKEPVKKSAFAGDTVIASRSDLRIAPARSDEVFKKTAFAGDESGSLNPTAKALDPTGKALDSSGKKYAFAGKKESFSGKKNSFAETSEKQGITLPSDGFEISSRSLDDGSLEISYTLPGESKEVFLGLWNQLAFYVKTLVSDKPQKGGRQTVIWDGKDDAGNHVGNGVYICRMSVDGEQGASSMVELGVAG
ncbi:MAG: hypothetical protein JKX81_10620 [Arenicella sp.]|nr:hypothetical protein [Arenicella sp.]